MRRLALLSVLLALPAFGGETCTTDIRSCGGGGGTGSVTGPAVACSDNAVVRWDGATTTVIQCSVPTISDAGAIAGLTGVSTTSVTDSGLTSGRVTIAGTAGLLADDADLTFATDTLTATKFIGSTSITNSSLTSGRVVFSGASGIQSDDADMTFATDTLTATNSVGSTSVCGGGATGATGSICTTTNTITVEGATADANELTIAFSDPTADSTATWSSTASGAALKLGDGSSSAPSITFTNSGTSTGIGGFSSTNLAFWANGGTSLVVGPTNVDAYAGTGTVITRLDATGAKWNSGVLTASTMTAETTGYLRTVTSSYTWTNAQVVALGAALTGDINVATLPAKTQVLDALVVITGAAAGPTTVTVSCGDAVGGTPFINYVVASDAKAAANTVYGDAAAERGTSIDTEFYYLPSYTGTTLVTCHFISTGANLNTVTGSTGRVILTTRLLP
jgi:hypothetical protein